MAGERSDVYTNEVDASFAAQILASTYAVVAGAAKEGPLEPQFVTDPNRIPTIYGTPDPSVTPSLVYPAIDFLKEGGGVWMKRVTDRTAEVGAALIQRRQKIRRPLPTGTDSLALDFANSKVMFDAGDYVYVPYGTGGRSGIIGYSTTYGEDVEIPVSDGTALTGSNRVVGIVGRKNSDILWLVVVDDTNDTSGWFVPVSISAKSRAPAARANGTFSSVVLPVATDHFGGAVAIRSDDEGFYLLDTDEVGGAAGSGTLKFYTLPSVTATTAPAAVTGRNIALVASTPAGIDMDGGGVVAVNHYISGATAEHVVIVQGTKADVLGGTASALSAHVYNITVGSDGTVSGVAAEVLSGNTGGGGAATLTDLDDIASLVRIVGNRYSTGIGAQKRTRVLTINTVSVDGTDTVSLIQIDDHSEPQAGFYLNMSGNNEHVNVIRGNSYSDDVDNDIQLDVDLAYTDDDNLLAIYAVGPGAYSSNIAIEIQSQNLAPPRARIGRPITDVVDANLITPRSGGSGSTVDGAHRLRVAAIGRLGETLPGNIVRVDAVAGTYLHLQWDSVAGAHGYAIYAASGATDADDYGFIGETAGTEFVWGGSPAIPTGDNRRKPKTSPPAAANYFDLLVYDLRKSRVNPVETFEVSLDDRIDGMGESSEVVERVNSQSQYIRVKKDDRREDGSDSPALWPTITHFPQTALGAGTDGGRPSSNDLIREAKIFEDKVAYPASIFLDGGHRLVDWQKELDRICHKRQDATCHVAVPATKQRAVNAVNYRVQELNANSNRMALYTNDHQVRDPHSGKLIYSSASSVAAARLAFTDRTRNAGFSHAGFKRGVPTDTLRLREQYTDDEMDLMALNRVNYFAMEPGFGFPLKESYTQQSLFSSLSFVPVRRVLDIIEQSSQRALRAYLQDPNDDLSADQIVANVTRLLRVMARRRMIFPGYVVHSDTPPEEVQLGNLELITVLKPRLPIVRIRHTVIIANQGADLTALLEQFLTA